MKTIPPTCPEPETGPKYWRGLDQLADTPEFQEWAQREFPAGASELTDPVSRRHFVKIMSASFLLAGFGLTGCRRPVEKIMPFAKMPENFAHGVPRFYATAMPTRSGAIPLLVKSHEGRPVKIEGNPEHPLGGGGTDRFAQASLLGLYDPDRAMRFRNKGKQVTREATFDFLNQLAREAKSSGGKGLAVLLDQSSSPSRARLLQELKSQLPDAKWFTHEPIDFGAFPEAAQVAFGQSVAPDYRFDQAKVILSLDADFLGAEPDVHVHIRRFSQGRHVEGAESEPSRLYVVEALMSLTGANADHRLRVQPSAIHPLAAALLAQVLENAPSGQVDARAKSMVNGLRQIGGSANVDAKWIQACARDLLAHSGKSLVVAGHRQPVAVQLIALALNVALGNVGKTVGFKSAPEHAPDSLPALARTLEAGGIETLVIIGPNPVHTAPANLNWPTLQRKARQVVRLAYYEDETAEHCDWHLPGTHYLESWGDARTADGTLVPVQPLIQPLFGGLTDLELLARLGGQTVVSPYEIVRATFRGLGGATEDDWNRFLHDGFLANSAAAPAEVAFGWDKVAALMLQEGGTAPGQDLEVVFFRDYSVDDGRFCNNGWLQELPDPVTKLTWENAVLMSYATAKRLNVDVRPNFPDNQVIVPRVKVTLDGREVEGPAWIQPGLADNTIALALGYGRKGAGRVGKDCGFDAYRLRSSTALYLGRGAKVASSGSKQTLAVTQTHWAMEGRPVIREANLEQFKKNPAFAQGMNLPEPEVHQPIYPNPLDAKKETSLHQWAMAIDLNRCVGCSACVLACQSENNIPIVGKEQVMRSREMHWIRIDRYYAGDPTKSFEEQVADPQVVTQPMLCQHCEAAPCESVCPVNATVHDEEGLNVMVYNRCVGTRYCSNNCPYKARRFNFFDYHKRPLDKLYQSPLVMLTDGEWEVKRWFKDPDKGSRKDDEWELVKLAKNPDVSVRMRGVMEKCTFCVQRLEQAKIAQKVKAAASNDVVVKDGAVKTACQQVCPAEAISFGNLKDEQSRVVKQRADARNYTVLEFLATKPRTTYLAKVRNPNPEIPGFYEMPLTAKEYSAKSGNPYESHSGAHGAAGGSHAAPAHPVSEKGAH